MALTPVQKHLLLRHGCFVSADGIIWNQSGLYAQCTLWTNLGRLYISGIDLLRFTNWGIVNTMVTRCHPRSILMPMLNAGFGQEFIMDGMFLPRSILDSIVEYSLNCYELDSFRRSELIIGEAKRLRDTHENTSSFQQAITELACLTLCVVVLSCLRIILKQCV